MLAFGAACIGGVGLAAQVIVLRFGDAMHAAGARGDTAIDVAGWMGFTATHPVDPAIVMGMQALLAGGAVVGLGVGMLFAGQPARWPSLDGAEGNDEWASVADAERAGLLESGVQQPGIHIGDLEPTKVLGLIEREAHHLVYSGPQHVLQVASSRSGKDVGPIAYTQAYWPYSIVANDPKGESYLKFAALRGALYGAVPIRFAPAVPRIGEAIYDEHGVLKGIEEFGSSRWSPFAEVRFGTAVEYTDLSQLWNQVYDPDGDRLSSENAHWYQWAIVLARGVSFKVQYDPAEPIKSVSRVGDLIAGSPSPQNKAHADLQAAAGPDSPSVLHDLFAEYLGFDIQRKQFRGMPSWANRTIERLRLEAETEIRTAMRTIGSDRSEADFAKWERERRQALAAQIARFDKVLHHPDLERDIRSITRIRGDEASSVLSTATGPLMPWFDENVMRNTAAADFVINDIQNFERPVYACVVSDVGRADVLRPIIKLFWTVALRRLFPPMKREGARVVSPHKYPCIWDMNEFATIGKMPLINEVHPLAAAYESHFFISVQTERQITENFGENEVITASSTVRIYHTPDDDDGAKALSERAGKRTVIIQTESGGGRDRQRSVQAHAQSLLTPGQARGIPKEPTFVWRDGIAVKRKRKAYCVAIVSGIQSPFYLRKMQYFYDKKLRTLIEQHPPVMPGRTRTSDLASLELAAAQAEVAKPYTPETPTRATLRESARLRKLPDVPPAENMEPPSRPASPSDSPPGDEPPPEAAPGSGSGAPPPKAGAPDAHPAPAAPDEPAARAGDTPDARARRTDPPAIGGGFGKILDLNNERERRR